MVGAFENLVIKETINPESQNYKKIRPEGNYTVDQVRSRIKDLFGVGESRYTPEVVVDGNPKWQDGMGEAARWTKPQTLQDAKEEKETYKNCPVSDGEWTGDRGNSKWIPDGEYVPQKQNDAKDSWETILDSHKIDGIEFNEGEPDFKDVSKGNVEIDGFSDSRDDNFDKADMELAEEKGCSPREVAQWRKENHYTWHECKDMKTMQKVPSVVHNNIPHSGGISEAKKAV